MPAICPSCRSDLEDEVLVCPSCGGTAAGDVRSWTPTITQYFEYRLLRRRVERDMDPSVRGVLR
jgi:predicted amidophosphoribosyltransferase